MKLKKAMIVLFALLMLAVLQKAGTVTAYADIGGSCGGNTTWILGNSGTLTIFGTGTMGNYTSSNQAPWYEHREEIKAIVVNEGVTGIGNYAFMDCTALKKVTFPETLNRLGSGVFYNCKALASITIPDGVAGIGSSAFYGCALLETVNIPYGVTTIGNYAFKKCSALKSLTIPYDVTSIGDGAFADCKALKSLEYSGGKEDWKDIEIGSGNECLTGASRSYYTGSGNCGSGVTWRLGSGKLTISGSGDMKDYSPGDPAPWCGARTNIKTVFIDSGVTGIGYEAFISCTSLTAIVMPDTVKTINRFAFEDCTSLKCIAVPGKVSAIEDGTFRGCTALESVFIPSGAATVGTSAFYKCSALSKVYYGGSASNWGTIEIAGSNNPLKNAKKVYETTGGTCGNGVIWLLDSENGVLTISGSGPMTDYPAYKYVPWYPSYRPVIKTIEIKEGVTRIGYYAFYGCSLLSDVKIPETVTDIAKQAFKGCSSLTKITLPESLKGIGVSAFEGCSALANVNYCGVKASWDKISINKGNTALTGATLRCRPTITTQPKDLTVASGYKASFTVKTTGGATSYQWYVSKDKGKTWTKSTTTSGKTSNYSFKAAASQNDYRYYCLVSNAAGSTRSDIVSLTVIPEKPKITVQPEDRTVDVGKSTKFAVTAEGKAMSFQWQYSADGGTTWKNVAATKGKTEAFSVTTSERHDGYLYRCQISNLKGTVYSNEVTLKVRPVITLQPEGQTVGLGEKAVFSIQATGAKTYQWYFSKDGGTTWKAISAAIAKTASYELTTAERHNGYQYKCEALSAVTKTAAESSAVTLKVRPKITKQPTDVSVGVGEAVSFKVTAENAVKYQWYYRKSKTGSWSTVAAASGRTAEYGITAASRHNGYQYRCKVSNDTSYVYSEIVTLTVK
ncbi:MAG: leucine-rich repeat protein [Lachnospiraceae bacterium]|nr:leucine-rich repeat protein [Lachnospiraceae bacterium]